jgi:hypothetical protein
MKSILAFALLVTVSTTSAAPEFHGMLSSKEVGIQFAVAPEPSLPPRWAKLGDNVGGYILFEFRATDDVLIFKKDGREYTAKLKGSKVQQGDDRGQPKVSQKQADYRGEPLAFEAAKELIASAGGWKSDVSYGVFRQKDGTWHLSASRRVGKAMQLRFLPLIPESIPAHMRPQK